MSALALMCIACTLLLDIFPGEIFSLFLESDDDMLRLAIHAIGIMGLIYIVRWISYSCQSFLSAIGINREATILSICSALVFPLLMMLLLGNSGLEGLWYVMPAAAVLSSLTAVAIYFMQIRKKLR